MNKRWRRGFEVARVSRLNSNFKDGFKMGAALYSGSRLLAIGFNVWKTHPKSRKGIVNYSLHAEHHALLKRQYCEDAGLIMYVYRETFGKPACSKPCAICMNLMEIANVKKIRYINKEGIAEEIKL